ncbi:MAG: hypothetical protein M0Q02_11320, partial [Candidatus Muirbacterium halophilum]|nr:hypothetical protein [Candidatus Muirbacterium halophilum]
SKNISHKTRSLIFIEMFRYYRNVNFPHLGEPYLEKALENIQNSGDIKEKLEIFTLAVQDYKNIFKQQQSEINEEKVIELLNKYSYFDYSDNPDVFFKACFAVKENNFDKIQSIKDIEKYFIESNLIENNFLKLSDFYFYYSKYIPDKITKSQKNKIKNLLKTLISKKSLTPEEIFVMTNLLYANMKIENNLDTFNYLKKYFENNYFDERIIDVFKLCVEQEQEKCTKYIYDNLTLKYEVSQYYLSSIMGNKLIETNKHIKAVKEIYRTYQDFKDSEEKNPEYIMFLAKIGEIDKAIECSQFYHDSMTLAEIGNQMIKYKKRATPNSNKILREILQKYDK